MEVFTQEKKDILTKTVVYTEAKNGYDNNKDNPLSGLDFIDSLDDDIVAFIGRKDIRNWELIPDEYILDDINRINFHYYIKWE